MAIPLRKICAEFRCSYLDQETILQSMHNCLTHGYELLDVYEYKQLNTFLAPQDVIYVPKSNFLFMASNVDVKITIDTNKEFSLLEFMLIQREYEFSFEIKTITTPSGCNVNIHYMHGRIVKTSN